jgi:putative transposase
MPWGLKRYQDTGHSHFVTFTCFHRRTAFLRVEAREEFERALERVRRTYGMCIYGYVIMPDHIHLLVRETERESLAVAIKSLKQGVARRLIRNFDKHFWQKRYYDLNIRNRRQFIEKLRYIHRNPVKAGLCQEPVDWKWSSFRHYASGLEGMIEIESEWTANKRERRLGTMSPVQELPHSSQQKA